MLLVLNHTGCPLDAVQFYTPNAPNSTLLFFAQALRTHVHILHVLAASPLTTSLPAWHSAPEALHAAVLWFISHHSLSLPSSSALVMALLLQFTLTLPSGRGLSLWNIRDREAF